jgi:hypothetical protein
VAQTDAQGEVVAKMHAGNRPEEKAQAHANVASGATRELAQTGRTRFSIVGHHRHRHHNLRDCRHHRQNPLDRHRRGPLAAWLH